MLIGSEAIKAIKTFFLFGFINKTAAQINTTIPQLI